MLGLIVTLGGEESVHRIYNGICAEGAFFAIFDGDAVVDHALYVAPVFGQS